jgi:hypothetical protein
MFLRKYELIFYTKRGLSNSFFYPKHIPTASGKGTDPLM